MNSKPYFNAFEDKIDYTSTFKFKLCTLYIFYKTQKLIFYCSFMNRMSNWLGHQNLGFGAPFNTL